MIEAARIVAEETGAFWTDQLNNEDQLAAYRQLAEEIWLQTEGRSTLSSRVWAQRDRSEGSQKPYGDTMGASASSRWSLPNPRCSRAARPALTRSMELEPASSCRSGARASPTTSSRYRHRMPRPWRFGSHGSRACSPGRRPAQMSSLRSEYLNAWRRPRRRPPVMCRMGEDHGRVSFELLNEPIEPGIVALVGHFRTGPSEERDPARDTGEVCVGNGPRF